MADTKTIFLLASPLRKGWQSFAQPVRLGLDRSVTRNVAILSLIQKKRETARPPRELDTSSCRLVFASNLSQQTEDRKSMVRTPPPRHKRNRTSFAYG